MNHKLRVLVRVDADTGQVTLETTGCLTQDSYPALLHIMRRSSRLAAGSDVSIDLHGASHLDPEILLALRQAAAAGAEGFQLVLQEPDELPICLAHVGSAGEVLADLDGGVGAVNGEPSAEIDADDVVVERIEGLELAEYFEGTLDPAATVQALSDAALGQFADALYRHLDTVNPTFGSHTWYELAAEELQQRYRREGGQPATLPAPDLAELDPELTAADLAAMDLAAEVLAGTAPEEADPAVTDKAAAGLAAGDPCGTAGGAVGGPVDGPADGELTAGPVPAGGPPDRG